jgi:hypothetical protein
LGDTVRSGPDQGKAVDDEAREQQDEAWAQAHERGLDRPRLASAADWPYRSAVCDDFGGSASSAEHPGARTACHADGASVVAVAQHPGITAPGVQVGPTSLSVSTRRDPVRGSVSSVTATATGVAIGATDDVLTIGKVTSVTETVARGRRRSATATRQVTVENVAVRHDDIVTTICKEQCDLRAVASQVNSLFSAGSTPILRMDLPQAHIQATPGGFQAVVRREQSEHLEDVAINGQAPDRVEVPAVTVTLFLESQRASRVIVDLAGTLAESRYGVYRLGDEGDGPTLATSPLPVDPGSVPALVGSILPLSSPDTGGPGEQVQLNTFGSPVRHLAPGLRALARALRLLATGDPKRLFFLWSMLLLPVYLAARRSLLLHRSAILKGRT